MDPWATFAKTAFLNSLKRDALVRAAPSEHEGNNRKVDRLNKSMDNLINLIS